MNDTTRSGLTPARIIEVKDNGNPKQGGAVEIKCMFNPYEYTVSKQNTFESKASNGPATPPSIFKNAGPQSLKLKLYFDTFEASKDVSETTRQLWKLMEPTTRKSSDKKKKIAPPAVAFEWGVFRFVSVIKSMAQKFTLFLKDGTPVRAEVNITFVQHHDINDYPKQNPTSGDGPVEQIWKVEAGDRIDLIAAEVYGDATKWPVIASYNNILNPHLLELGQVLSIPEQ